MGLFKTCMLPLGREGATAESTAMGIVASAGSVASSQGPRAVADHSLADCPKLDVILVPGGIGRLREVNNEALLEWLRRRSAEAEVVTSVRTGAALLARAGLLDGRRDDEQGGLRLGRRARSRCSVGQAGALGRGRPIRRVLRSLRGDRHDARRDRAAREHRGGRADRRRH
jgi:hypothetical protein